ncbi:MAG: heme exporter protein CcmB [Balneolales bacterium]
MPYLEQTWAIFLKDFRLEWRSRYGVSTVLAFIASSMLVVLLSLQVNQLSVQIQSGLIWILVLFASLTTLARVFISESERGTMDLLRLNSPAISVYLGKLLYNFLLTLLITSVTFSLFIVLVNMHIERADLFAAIVIFGSSGISGATTLLGALVSQAVRKGAVFPVVALPLLMPLMLVLVRITQSIFTTIQVETLLNDLAALIGFTGITISASIVLFDNLWED